MWENQLNSFLFLEVSNLEAHFRRVENHQVCKPKRYWNQRYLIFKLTLALQWIAQKVALEQNQIIWHRNCIHLNDVDRKEQHGLT